MSAVAPSWSSPPKRQFWAARAFCFCVVVLFLISYSGWDTVSAMATHMVVAIGTILALFGALGRVWCSSYAAGNKNAILLHDGPFSISRNPLYFFSFVGGLGIAITTETMTIPVLFSGWFALHYRKVIASEEQHLEQRYGRRYADYCALVPRFWPYWSGLIEPAQWTLCPRAFRRSVLDAVWFVVAAVTVHALHDLRDVMRLPSAFTLY